MFKRSSPPSIVMLLVLLANMFLPFSVNAANIPGTNIPTTVTRLMITNATTSPVAIFVTVQVAGPATQDGCNAAIANLTLLDSGGGSHPLTIVVGNPQQGTEIIPASTTWELVSTLLNTNAIGGAPQEQNCLQGITFTFLAPQACPNGTSPNGVNQFEPTINLPQTIGGAAAAANEAMDLTCVNGANSLMQVGVSPGAGNPGVNVWVYDDTKTVPLGTTLTTGNSWVKAGPGGCDDNCSTTFGSGPVSDRPLVFPYGCTLCNEFPNPVATCGPIPGDGQFCAAQNGLLPNHGCTIDRSPGTSTQTLQFGGTVLVSYLGPAIPPASCPGSAGGGGNNKHSGGTSKCIPLPKKPITAKELREYYAFKYLLLKELQKDHAVPDFFKRIELPKETCPPGSMMF